MATLTDEEKAAKLLEGVDEPKTQDEPEKETDDPTPPGDDSPASEETADEEKPAEAETEEAPSFTKQFQNLKGDSWEEYGPELETAYQNSFGEGLKQHQDILEKDKRIAELETQLTQSANPPLTVTPTTPSNVAPEVQALLNRAKAREDREMVEAFGEFAKRYPEAQEISSNDVAFQRFQTASQGVSMAIGEGAPYKELFEKTAAILGWQPSNASKDAAIKDSAAASSTVSATKPTPKVNVTEKELEVAKRMLGPMNTQSESELLKDLASIKS